MNWLRRVFSRRSEPEHLRIGRLGEAAAKRFLKQRGLRFLVANYRHGRGEIDLVFRDGAGLVFIEVKSRSSEEWVRPAAAVDSDKRRLLSDTALAYLKELGNPKVSFRFDIVEVLFSEGRVREVRHLANAFSLSAPRLYL